MGVFTIFVLLALFAVVLGSNREAYRVVGLAQYGALGRLIGFWQIKRNWGVSF